MKRSQNSYFPGFLEWSRKVLVRQRTPQTSSGFVFVDVFVGLRVTLGAVSLHTVSE